MAIDPIKLSGYEPEEFKTDLANYRAIEDGIASEAQILAFNEKRGKWAVWQKHQRARDAEVANFYSSREVGRVASPAEQSLGASLRKYLDGKSKPMPKSNLGRRVVYGQEQPDTTCHEYQGGSWSPSRGLERISHSLRKQS